MQLFSLLYAITGLKILTFSAFLPINHFKIHCRQIAHRDIKPENLLLKSPTDDTRIVLADFGFAVKCDGKSLNQVLLPNGAVL